MLVTPEFLSTKLVNYILVLVLRVLDVDGLDILSKSISSSLPCIALSDAISFYIVPCVASTDPDRSVRPCVPHPHSS